MKVVRQLDDPAPTRRHEMPCGRTTGNWAWPLQMIDVIQPLTIALKLL
jgi:hypothetical protein